MIIPRSDEGVCSTSTNWVFGSVKWVFVLWEWCRVSVGRLASRRSHAVNVDQLRTFVEALAPMSGGTHGTGDGGRGGSWVVMEHVLREKMEQTCRRWSDAPWSTCCAEGRVGQRSTFTALRRTPHTHRVSASTNVRGAAWVPPVCMGRLARRRSPIPDQVDHLMGRHGGISEAIF